MSPTSALSTEDYLALQQLTIEYVWRVDQAETDSIHELFTEDGRLSVPSGSANGRAEIIEWGRPRAGKRSPTLHVCTNQRFESAGPDRAAGATYVTVMLMVPEAKAPTPLLVGVYHDQFRRIDGTWHFESRVLDVLQPPSGG